MLSEILFLKELLFKRKLLEQFFYGLLVQMSNFIDVGIWIFKIIVIFTNRDCGI